MKRGVTTVSALALLWAIACGQTPASAAARTQAEEMAETADLNRASFDAAVAAQTVVTPAAPPAVAPPVEGPAQAAEAPVMESAEAASTATAAAPAARPDINPYDRDIAMTVPLNFNSRVLGEMPVILTRDDRFLVESQGFQTLIDPLLTEDARAELASVLAGVQDFAPEEINQTGIRLDYDPDQLAVLVLRIDPTKRSVENLFVEGPREEPGLPPEKFSAFLNANLAVQRYQQSGLVTAPSAFLNGAVRYGSVVFEADVQGRENLVSGDYEIERRYARFVLDQEKQYRRWTLGDLDPELRGRQGFVEMGGLGVERQRRRFDSFRSDGLIGARQLVVQETSTVRVLRNGLTVREFRLDPGQYDLSNLPLEAGSNDIQLEIRNDSGRVESVSYSAYLDLIDLDPGDYEYGAFLGMTSNSFLGSPDYSDGELAFTGYWRKSFINRPALGVGVQASERVQNVSSQTQFILSNGARLQLDGAASNGDNGGGYAVGLAFDHILDLGDTYDSWTVAADYTSEEFATLGNPEGDNTTSWVFSGSYNHRFNVNWQANVSASYRLSHDPDVEGSYGISAISSYRFTPQWTAQVGVEYLDFGTDAFGLSRDGFGVTFGLVWQPRRDQRVDARYSSASNAGSINYQKYANNRVGSLGYSLTTNYDDGAGNVSGQVDYIANRFDASISHAAFGRDFSNITEEQVTSVRVGTSIATTGGKVAIGRNIYDSFAIVYPHRSLRGRDVVVGEGLQGGDYIARGGALGPALSGQLTSYVNQSIRYDVLDPPRGYNIGDGVSRVRPTYKSGYAIEVGSAKFVSALGRLVGNAGRPVALMSGRIRPADDPTAAPELFFTNSVGRFAMQNLEPGKRYRVELFSTPALGFEFTVPADNEGLLDLQVVNVPLDVPED